MRNRRLLTAALLCALCLMLCVSASAQVYLAQPPADWEDKELFKLTVFDVNEGDAMLLECGGEAMMIDGGPNPFREDLKNSMALVRIRPGIIRCMGCRQQQTGITAEINTISAAMEINSKSVK